MRTVQQALEHAQQQKRYPLRDDPDLISDFILLAEELTRVRTYPCAHPLTEEPSVFIVIDHAAGEWDRIHFPQRDGTCIHYLS